MVSLLLPQVACGQCGVEFEQNKPQRKFCSTACQVVHNNAARNIKRKKPPIIKDCAFCQQRFEAQRKHKNQRFCSVFCRARWNGERARKQQDLVERSPMVWDGKSRYNDNLPVYHWRVCCGMCAYERWVDYTGDLRRYRIQCPNSPRHLVQVEDILYGAREPSTKTTYARTH